MRLSVIGGHGSWRGFDLFDGVVQGDAAGPVVVITRATVRLRVWRRFARASQLVDRELRAADGLLAVAGFGEAPIGRLGTISVWTTADAARRFAMSTTSHRDAITSTRVEGWFREELFAWFVPIDSTGTWDGSDPLGVQAQPT